jgi:hypothetical protein
MFVVSAAGNQLVCGVIEQLVSWTFSLFVSLLLLLLLYTWIRICKSAVKHMLEFQSSSEIIFY